jgi:mannose-6-phosphate isomerase-like protein (cupin superfamily)
MESMGAGEIIRVAAGEDRFGEHRGLGISEIDFKVTGAESDGLFVLENIFHAKGGPARHLHFEQDEWFHVLEGEFLFEIGTTRMLLTAGESVLGPRMLPHVWAHAGEARGRILIAFAPAGKMEAFFRDVTRADAMPPQDPALWLAHGMQLLGPPLALS